MAIANPMLSIRREVALKIETTKGTFEGTLDLTGTDSKILCQDLKLSTAFGVFDRNFCRNTLSKVKHLLTDKAASLTFKCEVRRTGTLDTSDKWMEALEGCGFKKTVNAGVDVRYKPDSDFADMKCLSFAVWNEGYRVDLKGCMGNVMFSGKVGEPMFAEFSFMGAWAAVTADLLNAPTHETGDPVPFQGTAFTWDGSADYVIQSLSLDMGNKVVYRRSINDSTGILMAIITGRDPKLKFDPEELATFPFYTALVANSEKAVTWNHGSTKIAFSVPKGQISGVEEADRDGVLTSPIEASLNRSAAAGDDEIEIVMT